MPEKYGGLYIHQLRKILVLWMHKYPSNGYRQELLQKLIQDKKDRQSYLV